MICQATMATMRSKKDFQESFDLYLENSLISIAQAGIVKLEQDLVTLESGQVTSFSTENP